MPIFSFSEADRKRWAAQGALAVQTAAERTRASMADNLEAFGEDSFPDVPGEVFDQQEWLDEMNGEIADYFDEIAAEAAYAFADGAEIDPTDGEDGGPGFFTSAAILAMTGLIGYEIAQMLSNRGEIVADRVETLMGRGSEDGWDSTRLGDELGLGEDTSGPLSDALAEAMGESSATSISEGAAHGMIELGQMVGTKTWNCMFRNSRDSHMDADGQTVAVDELFVLAGGEGMYPGDPELPPEESINCVLPDTVLSADEISRAYRRIYSGPVVRLSTRAGHDLTVTPNHPVLTGRGWVPACEVQPSVDHLYRLVDEAVITGVDPHIQGDPASEVFVAARDAGVVHRVVGSSMDFHGDGRVTDVEVVSTDRLLRTSDVAALSKSLQEFMLVGADELEGALAGPGFGRQLVGPGLASASGGVGGNDRRGVSFLSGSLGFAPSSEFSPGLGEPMVDRPTGHVEISGEALDGLAGVVAADEVVSIEWGQWSGYVFNLGTASNWYGANGLIAHNCQCWVTYSIDSPDEGVVEGEASADEEGGALADITPGDSGDGTADAGALSVGRVPQKRGVGLYAAGDVALLRDGTDSVTLVNSKSLADNSNGGRWAVREFGGPGSGPHKVSDAEKADRAERKAVIDEQKSLKGTTGKEGRPRDEAKIAEIRGTKGSDTQKDFKDANGKYTPERQALHAQIIASFLEGVPKADGTPSVTFLGGGPAAGKSTVETSGRSGMPSTANREAVLVNADEIKNMLPEMDKLVEAGDRGAAGFVHEESSDVSAMLLQAALDGGYHTVVDAVGDSSTEKMGAKIDAARASGAAVKGLYVTAPTDVAVARAEARGEKKGRFVGESIVRAGHASVSRIFPQIADKFDSVQLFDSGTGGEPKLLGEGTFGQPFTVHDDAGYGTFLAKGTA